MVTVGQRRILGRVDDQPQWHAGISFGANGHATMLQPTGVLLLSQPAWDNEVATVSEWSDSSPRPPSDVMDVVMGMFPCPLAVLSLLTDARRSRHVS
jgi:hypothetical protein